MTTDRANRFHGQFQVGDIVTRFDRPLDGEYEVRGWEYVGCRGRWEVQAFRPNAGISMPADELRLSRSVTETGEQQ